MDNQPVIFILSDNREFIETLSSLVTRELGVSCRKVASEPELSEGIGAMLVTDRALVGEYQFPVIIVNLPVRINILLEEIQGKLDSFINMDILDINSDWRLSLQHKTLAHRTSGATVALTDKESRLLQIISQAGDSGISRELLLKEVWKIDSALDTHTLETHIYRLRKKIRDAFDVEMIKAFEGGYRL